MNEFEQLVWKTLLAAATAAMVITLISTMSGCGTLQMSDRWCDAHPAAGEARCWGHTPAQSWDQANLKRHDVGCPTAIYVAPGGHLEQCE